MIRHRFTACLLVTSLPLVLACSSNDSLPRPAGTGATGPTTGGASTGGSFASGGGLTGGAPMGGGDGSGGFATGGANPSGGGPGTGGVSPTGGSGGSGTGGTGTGGSGTGGSGTGGTGGDPPDTSPVGRHGHLSVSGTRLVDQHGTPVQLKGISSQWLNLELDGYATSLPALEWMRDNWGLTVFRAAMGAEEVGTSPGYTTNEAGRVEMLRQVELIINNAIEAGVYVIVDWHSHNALSQQAAAVAFFSDLSQRYGQHPNVLFETFNEPLDVDWNSALKPYHEAVVNAIRTNDPDSHANVALLGTPQWCQRPDHAASSPLSGSNLMYVVHFYSCTHNADSGSPPPWGDGISHLARAQNALQAGLPLFITEWGATEADGGVGATAVCSSEADGWHNWMNANQIGWAAWKLDDCDTENPPDTSCLLQRDAALEGGWSSLLNGHGSYVVSKLQN